jgi:hypothetical protein
MSFQRPPPPTDLSERFALAIEGLCAVLAMLASRERAVEQLMMWAWRRLRRTSFRITALIARFRAGTLRRAAPRQVTRRAASDAPARPAPPVLAPRRFGWLFRMMPEVAGDGYHVCSYRAQVGPFRNQLRGLLADPEMLALIEAAPQAARLLRSLCHMLQIEPTPALRRRRPPAEPTPPMAAPSIAPPAPPPDLVPQSHVSNAAHAPGTQAVITGLCLDPRFIAP